MPRWILAILLLTCFVVPSIAEDWPFFRGPRRDGKSAEQNVPLEWSKEKNVKWKVPLPRPGNGSPIVVGNRVFVACAQDPGGHRRTLFCFYRADGKKLWEQTVNYDPVEPMHGTNPFCGSTPAADNERVIVWHGSAGLFCYDPEGKPLWKTDLGAFRHIWGYASSPVIHGDAVYLNCGPGVRTFVVAVNEKDGKILWQTDEPGGADDRLASTKSWIGSWSSPVVARVGGAEQLLVYMPLHVNAYDLASGKILWTCSGPGEMAYTDVMLGGDLAIAIGGYGGAAIGFKPGGSGDIAETRRIWRSVSKPPQRISTGIIHENHLYLANEPGLIVCMEARTGKEVWSHRLGGQTFWSAMLLANNRLYLTSQKGTTFVFAPDPAGFKLLASNELGQRTNATPAISNGQFFIRTWESLYCIGGN